MSTIYLTIEEVHGMMCEADLHATESAMLACVESFRRDYGHKEPGSANILALTINPDGTIEQFITPNAVWDESEVTQ